MNIVIVNINKPIGKSKYCFVVAVSFLEQTHYCPTGRDGSSGSEREWVFQRTSFAFVGVIGGGELLVVIVFLGLKHKHCDAFVGSDVACIGYVISTDEGFWMAQACARMLHDVHQNFRRLLDKLWIGFLPLAQRPVGLLGILNRVVHRLSK